jgi:DNA-binding transcriptional MerR regulator
MSKSPDAFRSIGEVSHLVGVAPHVLRYWESQFSQLSPVKRADGRRYYRPDDVRLVAGLCQVLREEGLSIRGAKRLITADRGAGLRDIGAARLGEAMGETGAAPAPAIAPVVQLAIPKASKPPAAKTPATKTPAASAATPRQAAKPATPAPRRRKTADPLPLFPDLESQPAAPWLARLVISAATLRLRALEGKPLPQQAKALRDGLRDAR